MDGNVVGGGPGELHLAAGDAREVAELAGIAVGRDRERDGLGASFVNIARLAQIEGGFTRFQWLDLHRAFCSQR